MKVQREYLMSTYIDLEGVRSIRNMPLSVISTARSRLAHGNARLVRGDQPDDCVSRSGPII